MAEKKFSELSVQKSLVERSTFIACARVAKVSQGLFPQPFWITFSIFE